MKEMHSTRMEVFWQFWMVILSQGFKDTSLGLVVTSQAMQSVFRVAGAVTKIKASSHIWGASFGVWGGRLHPEIAKLLDSNNPTTPVFIMHRL